MPTKASVTAATAIVLSLVATSYVIVAKPPQMVAIADGWGPIIRLRAHTGEAAAPIHVSLLKDGRVHLFGVTPPLAFFMTPTPVGINPSVVTMLGMRPPLEFPDPGAPYGGWDNVVDTIYCAGHTLLADGSLFTAGGMRAIARTGPPPEEHFFGLSYATILSYPAGSWVRVPEKMTGTGLLGTSDRWYPTVTRLADSRLLITAGADVIVPPAYARPTLSVERYNPGKTGADTWTLLSSHQQSPAEIFNLDYTHVFQLPNKIAGFDVLMFGDAGKPVLMSLEDLPAQRWLVRNSVRPGTIATSTAALPVMGHHGAHTGAISAQDVPPPGPSFQSSSVLLPLRLSNENGEAGYFNGTVLTAGGRYGSTYERTIDVYDPVQDAWIAQIDMGVNRRHPSTVILPDGRILILAGHSDMGDPNVGFAQYVDPKNGFSLSKGTAWMPEVRGYHTISVLLPDGRVMVGGGNPDNAVGRERADFRYYSPDYIRKPRPMIVEAPAVINMGATFTARWRGASVGEVILIELGSMTHSFDMAQRAIELEIVQQLPGGPDGKIIEIKAPPRAEVAPPGYYMLFLVDETRVPSRGWILKLE